MKKAALLYDFIQNGLRGDDEGDGQGQNQDEGSEPHPEAQNLAGSIEAITVESAEALSARFQLREVVLSGDKSSLKSTCNQDQLHVKIPIYHKPILRRISNRCITWRLHRSSIPIGILRARGDIADAAVQRIREQRTRARTD